MNAEQWFESKKIYRLKGCNYHPTIKDMNDFKNESMKKIIDIPDEILEDLQILAVKAKKDLKNFIQGELKKLVEHSQSKPS